MRVISLIVLLALAASLVWAGHLEPVLGLGLEVEKPRMNPAIWAGIIAQVDGRDVAALSTDTPVSVVGLRGPGISYLFRVGMQNLPHVEWVKVGINSAWYRCQKEGDYYQVEIDSEKFLRGPNLVRLKVHGKFKRERLNLLLFRPSWRRHGEVEGQLTMYLIDADSNDPAVFFSQHGWVMLTSSTPLQSEPVSAPTSPPPQPLMSYGPPYQPPLPAKPITVPTPATPAPVPAPTPTHQAQPVSPVKPPLTPVIITQARTTAPSATATTFSSPIRFLWQNEEIEGKRLYVEASRPLVLKVRCPTGPTIIRWVQPDGAVLTKSFPQTHPPLIVKLPALPAGTSRLIVKVGETEAELEVIAGGDN